MYSLEDIKIRSISRSELVVDFTDAMELIYLYREANTEWQEVPEKQQAELFFCIST